jgi:hypothetical protein
MIRVERGAEISPGVYAYTPPSLGVSGQSRQPLLDACRQIKSLLGPTGQLAGLFREGHSDWDTRCRVDVGAELTVKERALVESALPSICHSHRHSGKPPSKAALERDSGTGEH